MTGGADAIADVLLPSRALSIRQPWAWAVARGLKPIENRDWRQPNPALQFRGAFCVHAATGMTREEYLAARDFMAARGVTVPLPAELRRGGIIGTARVETIIKASENSWFTGRIGLVLAGAREVPFIPAAGELGFFEWRHADKSFVPEPAKWMRAFGQPASASAASTQADLFADEGPRSR
jgi:hypothetical protein